MSTNDENNNEKKVSENDSIEAVNQNITVNNEAEDKVNSEDAVNQDAQPSVDEQTLLEIEAIQAAIEAQEGEEILDEDTETAAGETSDGGSSSAVEFERDGTEIIASTDFQTEGFGFETIEPIQINQDLNAVDADTANAPIVINVDLTEAITEDDVTSDTIIATVSATDEDGGDIIYSLSDDDSAYYIIDNDTGVITLTDEGIALVNSGEDLPSFTVTAESTSGITSTGSQIVEPSATIVTNDPIELTVETTELLTEDTVTTDTVIATASATDEDGGDITYSLSDDDSTYFVIDSDTGVVTLTDAGVALVNSGEDLPDFTITADSTSGESSTTSEEVNPADTIEYNDAPTAEAETAAVIEGETITGSIATADIDGTVVSVAVSEGSTTPTGLTLNADGSYEFDASSYDSLAVDETLEFVVPVTVTDNDGVTTTTNLTITVTGTNDAPMAEAETAAVIEGETITGSIATADIDGTVVSVAVSEGSTTPTGLTLNADGSYEFDASSYDSLAVDETLEFVVPVTVTDNDGATTTTNLTITVTGTNDAPTAEAETAAVIEGETITGSIATADIDGTVVSVAVSEGSTTPTGLTLNADGSYEFDASSYDSLAVDETLEFVVPVTVTDNDGATTTTNLTITVNDEGVPTAVADTATTTEEVGVDIDVLGNDTLTDDATLTGFDSTSANGGTVTENPDGTLNYTPAANFEGTDTFDYIITDEDGSTSTATVTITVNDEGVPTAVADTATTTEEVGVDIDVLGNDTLTDDATLTGFDSTSANGGTVTENPDGTLNYTPAANFEGTDTFDYIITDEDGSTSTATVTITVNDEGVPTAVADTATTTEEVGVDIDVLGNDTLTDDATLTDFDSTSANGGTVTENPDGTLNYTPAANFEGTDTFDYIITDEDGSTSTATVTITVNDEGVPTAVADTATTTEEVGVDIDVLGNDTLTDDATLTGFDSTSANGGTVTENPDGTLNYTPTANFEGTDTFDYIITDEDGSTSTATVTITVNDEGVPTAVADTATTTEEVGVDIDVLGNDTLTDDATLTGFDSTSANGGTVTENPDGTLNYTPAANFEGTDTFDYIITDEDGSTSTATVTITVNDEGVPTAVADTATTTEEVGVDIDVLGNDTLTDDATLTGFDSTSANGGTVTENPDGTLNYTPTANFEGTDTFDYIITDEDGSTSTATVTITVNDEGVPTAVADTATTTEEVGVDIDVLGNDTLTDDATLTGFDSTSANGGTVTENPDGTLNYTPAANFEGTDTFDYIITDEDGSTSTATVTITVNDEGVPTAVADTATTTEEVGVDIDVLGNDMLTDDATLTGFDSTSANGGTVTENPDGTLNYTPAANFEGTDTFDYIITDEDGSTSTATVTITVNDEGVPTAVADTATTTEEVGVDIDVLGNDTLTDDATLTGFDSTSANGGTVTENPDGTLNYTPAANFEGTDTFDYIITDEDGSTSTATVTITVNDEGVPTAVADTATTTEEVGVDIDVLGNDTLTDDATLTGFDSTSANGGTVTENPDGTLNYTPAANFEGTDTFDYIITDEDGSTSTATVTITVNDEGVPTAVADTATTTEEVGVDIDVLGNDTLTDDATLTGFDSTSANGGTVTENPDGTLNYTPAANFEGTDTFDYIITDEDGSTSTATVTITVNDEGVPTAVADTATTTEEVGVDIDVLGNDTLTDDATLTGFDSTSANGGTVTENPDGTLNYTPAANFEGTDTFDYIITDEDGSTSTATVTITVNDEGVPTAVADTATTTEEVGVDIDVLGNDTLTDDATLTGFDSTSANGGTVTENPDGTLNYTPAANFEGTDTFDYIITDEDGSTSTATVTITVNDEGVPTAVADTATTTEEVGVDIDVLGNDTLTDDATLTDFDSTSANGGTVTENPDGTLNYTPAANFEGTDTFDYIITDEDGSTSTATVTITVNDEGVPTAVADTATTTEEVGVDIDVLGNDTLTDDATLTDFDSTSANGGTVTENPDGTLNYTPAANFEGTDTFDYIITDEDGSTSTATVTITVNDEGVPTAVADTATTTEEVGVDIDVLGNDTLTDDATLTGFDSTSANGGTVTENPDGTLNYTPAANFEGTDTFDYIITDEDGSTSTATVTITVNDEGVPTAVADTATTTEEVGVDIDVLGNDTLTDDATLTGFDSTSANGGTVTENPDGTLNYTPAANFEGTDTFDYIITDEDGSTSTATVTITVNDEGVPTAVADTATTTEEVGVDIDVLGNDTLTDDATLTDFDSTSANGGTVTENPDGTLNYTPAANFEGTDTFDYIITDEDGSTSTATVTITVNDEGVPTAVADTATTTEEVGVDIDVLGNDTLTDDATLTDFDSTSANGGTVTENPDGTLNYTPAANFEGTDTFDYIITDEDGSTSTATVTITVNDEGVPTAVADTATTTEEVGVDIDVLGNDTLTDDATLTDFDSTSANGGTVTENPDGTLNYTPAANFEGTDTFDYIITDEDGSTSTATVTITVNDEGVPTAVADTATTTEEVGVDIDVLGNDTLTDDATLTGFDSTSANGGTVTENPDGTLNYTPAANFEGTDTFDYIITDEDGSTSTATVTITVNDEGVPTAVADTATTTEEVGVDIDVLGNDTLIDDATLTGFDSTSANGGTVTENPDGTLNYTPAANFEGTDTFDYIITDEDGSTSTATVTITVNDEGVPTAVADTATTTEEVGVDIDVLGNDTLTDDATLTGFDSTSANGGTVTENPDGTLNYTPAANFEGTDTFDYIITDEDGSTSTATVTITVNDEGVPTAVADTATTTEEVGVDIDVLGNDTLTDDATLTDFDSTSANGGTVTENPDGTLNYTPAANFEGTDTFDYIITDEDGSTSTATVTVTVDAVDDVSVVKQDFGYTNEDPDTALIGNVLTNDSDEDDILTVASFTIEGQVDEAGELIEYSTGENVQLDEGTLMLDANGTYTFTPTEDWSGTVPEITYTTNTGSSSTLDITVSAVVDRPTLTVTQDTIVTQSISVTAENYNDTDNGFTLTAFSTDGTESTISSITGTDHDGFGVLGSASGNTAELGYTNGVGSESIVATFDNDILSADVAFAWLNPNESATYILYLDGIEVGTGTIDGGSDTVDSPTTIDAAGTLFDEIVFTATGNGDDYLIHSITFDQIVETEVTSDPIEVTEGDSIDLNIYAELLDTDGSESLAIIISNIPKDFTLSDGVNTYTTTKDGDTVDITDWDLNDLSLLTIDVDSDTSYELLVTATSTESSTNETTEISSNIYINVTSDGVASGIEANNSLYNTLDNDSINGLGEDDYLINSVSFENADVVVATSEESSGDLSSISKNITIDIDDDSTRSLSQIVEIPENTTEVDNYAATDTENDAITYSLSGDDSRLFEIDDNGNLSFINAPDYDAGETGPYYVTVIATDNGEGGLSDTQDVIVGVSNVVENTAPTIINEMDNVDIVENSTAVGNYAATDTENATITYSLSGDDAALFEIDENGDLTFINAPDYDAEETGPYNVTVIATDDGEGSLYATQDIIVGVSNEIENTAPNIDNTETNVDIAENTTAVGNYAATDTESDAITYSLSGEDAALFEIDENGDLSFINAPDYDAGETGPYNVTVIATDDGEGTLSGSQDITIKVNNEIENTAPIINNETDSIDIAENTAAVGNYAATDAESDVITYSLSGEHAALFEIDENGDLSFINAPDYDAGETGPFNVTITATDDGEGTLSATHDLVVNVSNVNEAPVAEADTEMAYDTTIRLDEQPEHGTVQVLIDDEWVEMVVGEEYASDAEVQFIPDEEAVKADSIDIKVGSFNTDNSSDFTASVDDWGTVIDDAAVFVNGDTIITTSVVTTDPNDSTTLAAWNGATHIGNGIGNEKNNGLNKGQTLVVDIEGENVNQVTFTLDGLGGFFDATSKNATEVLITAYFEDGTSEVQSGYRESGTYEDTYQFTTDKPVDYFTLTTQGSNGSYVVQNMTLSRTLSDEVTFTRTQADGTETTEALGLDLNYDLAHVAMDLTAKVPQVNTDITQGTIFTDEDSSISINALSNDSDVDGDELTITEIEGQSVSDGGAVDIIDDGNLLGTAQVVNGEIVFTPSNDLQLSLTDGESQDVVLEYTISDGLLTDDGAVTVRVDGADEISITVDTHNEIISELNYTSYLETVSGSNFNTSSDEDTSSVYNDVYNSYWNLNGSGNNEIVILGSSELITINSGDGDDTIAFGENPGTNVNVNGGNGNDVLILPGSSTDYSGNAFINHNDSDQYYSGQIDVVGGATFTINQIETIVFLGDSVTFGDSALTPTTFLVEGLTTGVEEGQNVAITITDGSGNSVEAETSILNDGSYSTNVDIGDLDDASLTTVVQVLNLDGEEAVNTLITGSDGNDVIDGTDGGDSIDGAEGDDILDGGLGNDFLIGGDGNDTLIGGLGHNTLTGGDGADTYVWNIGVTSLLNTDHITDFDVSEDKLDLSGLLTDVVADNLDTYLDFSVTEEDGITSTTINVATGVADVTQSIVLDGVDLSSYGSDDATIINGLMEGGILIVSDTTAETVSSVAETTSADFDDSSLIS
ncbi:Ig-like domain-containing protein [Psychromonas sp. PT13]|uniref:Ig-like domain-containing protein n=1 Tax=Psychromonas sp. PT13 TaxID=3439547 RepID=UPI003EB7D7A9